MGDWYVWSGVTNSAGPLTRSAIGVNLSRRWTDMTDGLSNTLLMSEVKNYQPTVRDCSTVANINDPNNIPPPDADPLAICPEYAGGGCAFFLNAHTQWAEMSVHHNGFTTAWPPNKENTRRPRHGAPRCQCVNARRRIGGPTFRASTHAATIRAACIRSAAMVRSALPPRRSTAASGGPWAPSAAVKLLRTTQHEAVLRKTVHLPRVPCGAPHCRRMYPPFGTQPSYDIQRLLATP